jgi:hypothetical protein
MDKVALKLSSVGTYLDHPYGAILPWANRVPVLVYPTLLALQTGKDLYQSKTTKERNERLEDDAIRMGIPTVATVMATQCLMSPDAQAFNTTQAALAYFKQQNRDVFQQGQAIARSQFERLSWLSPLLWGKLDPKSKLAPNSAEGLFQSIEAGQVPLDVQVGGVAKAIRSYHKQKRPDFFHGLKDREFGAIYVENLELLEHLHRTSMAAVLENAHNVKADPKKGVHALPHAVRTKMDQETNVEASYKRLHEWINSLPEEAQKETRKAIVQLELPQRIAEDLKIINQLQLTKFSYASLARRTSRVLLRHELRLALPTHEDLSDFAGAFEGGRFSFKAFEKAMGRTAKEFVSEAAIPFLGVGLASVGSGVLAGFLANHLQGKGEKNDDVVKEGIFQYVANIAMCGFGAGAGLAISNALGFTKFRNPLARFATVVSGLGAGIYAGALIANPLSNFVETQLKRRNTAPHPPSGGRKLEFADGVLHIDDIPTAFSVAGVQALKPWISPFFLMSGIKTAYGYRNVEPLAHSSPIPVGRHEPLQLDPFLEHHTPFGGLNDADSSTYQALMPQLKSRITAPIESSAKV